MEEDVCLVTTLVKHFSLIAIKPRKEEEAIVGLINQDSKQA